MKKVILATALIVGGSVFAQNQTENETATIPENRTVTVYLYTGGLPAQIGVYFEAAANVFDNQIFWHGNIAYAGFTYEAGGAEVDMTGYVSELGTTNFLSKTHAWKGLYYSNSLSNGKFKYDEDGANAEYQYWSFFAPEFGYKLMLGPIAVVPYIGTMWKIEVKGKGGIDNKNVDNWESRLGIRLGYSF